MANQRRQQRRASPDGPAKENTHRWPDRTVFRRTMFGAPVCAELEKLDAQVAFIGIPFDQGTGNRPGARFGPNAMRDAGVNGVYKYRQDFIGGQEAPGFFDLDKGALLLEGVTMADCGDVNVVPSDVALAFDRLTRSVRQILDRGTFPVILGGDHAITFPSVRGFDRYEPLDIVHFDAHMDFTHAYQGEVYYTHGSPIKRAAELPFVRNITSIGLRIGQQEPYEDARQRGVRLITARQFHELGPEAVVDQVPRTKAMYITLDIDVLDPIQAPGTGTPVTGGLFYQELTETLRLLTSRSTVVGLDVVEVAPPYDHAETTSKTALRLIQDLLSVRFPPSPSASGERAAPRRRTAPRTRG